MRMPRVTIKRLMIGVAAAGLVLGYFAWRDYQTAVFRQTDELLAATDDERWDEIVFPAVPESQYGGFLHKYVSNFDSPYCVVFASRIASSSESNGITDTTGPKISSRAIRISFVTPSKTVGMRKAPSASSGSEGGSPPTTTVAPSPIPISM